MGAGQIGGMAPLLDIDFDNAPGFLGRKIDGTEAQYIVYYLSHAMMFCTGALIEPHVVLTPASCVFGEKYKFDIFAGTHEFLENTGTSRTVHHVCLHKGYNHSMRWHDCVSDNLALLVLNKEFSFHRREEGANFIINRIRYGAAAPSLSMLIKDNTCRFYGWGSRRSGYLLPLLIHLRRMDVTVLSPEHCLNTFNYGNKYICISQPPCRTDKYGALCPDELGTVLVCSGYVIGMMTSRLIDRPCGVGFLDLSKYNKFLTCGVDDSRDVMDEDISMTVDFTTKADTSVHTRKTSPPTINTSITTTTFKD